MSTGTTNQISATDVPTELAHRARDGIQVVLLWDRDDGRLKVVVDDLRGGGSFELAADNGGEALDAFYHPFAYAAARCIAFRGEARAASAFVAAQPPAPASSLRQP